MKELLMNVKIRKIKMLNERLREKAIPKGFKLNDYVIVRTTLEKIEGSAITYLQKKLLKKKVVKK